MNYIKMNYIKMNYIKMNYILYIKSNNKFNFTNNIVAWRRCQHFFNGFIVENTVSDDQR